MFPIQLLPSFGRKYGNNNTPGELPRSNDNSYIGQYRLERGSVGSLALLIVLHAQMQQSQFGALCGNA